MSFGAPGAPEERKDDMETSTSTSILDSNTTACARELAPYLTARSGETPGGPRYITAKLIYSWFYRKDEIGFPDSEPEPDVRDRTKPVRVWKVAAVWEWFQNYQPSRGGAPAGNRNAHRHGRFVGERARRAERVAARERCVPAALSEEDEREVSRLEGACRYWERRAAKDTSLGVGYSHRDAVDELAELRGRLNLCTSEGCRNLRDGEGEQCPRCALDSSLTTR